MGTPPPQIVVVSTPDPPCDLSRFPLPGPGPDTVGVVADPKIDAVTVQGWFWKALIANIAAREARREKLEACERERAARRKARGEVP